jgi:hypothetical protein
MIVALPFSLVLLALGEPTNVWLMEQPGFKREESAFIQALRIYTGDLHVAVTLGGSDPGATTAAAQLRSAQDRCSPDIAIVAWFADAKAPVVRILRCATLSVDEVPHARQGNLEDWAQNLALKIRGLLDRDPSTRSQAETRFESPRLDGRTDSRVPDADSNPPPLDQSSDKDDGTIWKPRLTLSDLPDLDVVDAAPAQKVVSPPARAPLGAELAFSYAIAGASDGAGLSQGAAMRLALALRRQDAAVELDGAWITSVTRRDSAGTVKVGDVPIGLGVVFHWRDGKWMLAYGPRLSVHVFQAETTTADGSRASSSGGIVGLGGSERLRYNAWERLGFELTLVNELLPWRNIAVGGREIAAAGWLEGALTAGAVYQFY